ncbi:plastocyanin/azurin family copper-binding protein [Spiribacter halobius]|uniref:Blue (type 1) copper domain-containing protein n=1 Tax=Sediminicurvatus halobius TaxID=2182432 RepID=A0A2U2MWY3_9GAMM|nr:plastocyanin/azurin family copper-binding protein [Spiribacter halobius]PWG61375.1 hypothetical protein DEM34_16800 [Spiribacter halobius]UEX76588.1 hypothetical protein LMH63_11535 [Spiribacter halobius]
MLLNRRRILLGLAGGGLAALVRPGRLHSAASELIEMRGTPRGERVWFSPLGVAVAPGTTVRFANRDRVNSHTVTAYHPDVLGRPRRIPVGAEHWHSGFLLPQEVFEVTLTRPGVYDYYCLPHERAGMVGRIVVGGPGDHGWQPAARSPEGLPPAAANNLPPVAVIFAAGRVNREAAS